jgi:alkylation response protein AidB-like acyl-CoA dehydrogenase
VVLLGADVRRLPDAGAGARGCRASWCRAGARRHAQRASIQRLKDKLGNRSNASSEIEYRGTWALLVGEEGRGVRTIIEMVHHTRLDCVIGSHGACARR